MIFLENKYTKIYNQLISKRKLEILSKKEIYCETHHIIPKSLGGSNDADNLVNLLPREHFIAHLLLTKMIEDKNLQAKMNWAVHKMSYSCTDYFNGRDYEWYRERHSKFLRNNPPSSRIPNWSETVRERVIKSWEGADKRREELSNRSKQYALDHRSDESYLSRLRDIAKLGGISSKVKNSKRIEYMGTTYIGWNDLLEKTGVSKFVYQKFYLQGFDPTDRIGKNGPIPKDYVYKPLNGQHFKQ